MVRFPPPPVGCPLSQDAFAHPPAGPATATVDPDAATSQQAQIAGLVAQHWEVVSDGPSGVQLRAPRKLKILDVLSFVLGLTSFALGFLTPLAYGIGLILLALALLDYDVHRKREDQGSFRPPGLRWERCRAGSPNPAFPHVGCAHWRNTRHLRQARNLRRNAGLPRHRSRLDIGTGAHGHPTHESAWNFLASVTSFAVTLPPASCVLSRITTRL